MDLKTLSNSELSQLRSDVMAEQDRREDLATIPGQITELKQKYVDGGGDPKELL